MSRDAEEDVMKIKMAAVFLFASWFLLVSSHASGQNLPPTFKKVKEGIFVYAGRPGESNCTIILTQEGVVLIDSGNNPPDSVAVQKAVKQLTPQPVRFLINTEPHNDHTTGHFVFSPPAVIIAAAGASESMRGANTPARIQKLMADHSNMGDALKDFRVITPHIEYKDKMTLNLGERTFELSYLKNVHSEADTAIWLPKEKVLFTAASIGVKRFNNLRPFVSIPDTLSAIKMMKALNPEVVIPGHGVPGSAKILDDMEKYYNVLMERVGAMVKAGKSLDEIKKELKIPGTEDWEGKDRFPNNIEAAYRAIKGS
ncbi:MAG: MBL fold metallo-hydrolase [Deltaproteobacteria bacterium]|nr:MAG: MBL fold metallo-hydrolase [Deltaproteobacteria bacterium]